MVKLLLWRHAEASWSSPDQQDIDRQLTAQGRQDGKVIAEKIMHQFEPDITICSVAQRTRETLKALEELTELDPLYISETLYHCYIDELMTVAMGLNDSHQTALFIGHNPSFEDIILAVADNGQPHFAAHKELPSDFTPGALAVLEWDSPIWGNIAIDQARITLIIFP